MPYPLPSWIQPADPTANMLAGIRQGASIGEAQAQQAQFQQQLAARQKEQQERLRAEALRTQAEMETQKAYRQAQQALAQDRIKEEAKRAEETARHNLAMEGYRGQEVTGRGDNQAQKFLAQQKFAQAYQKHLSVGDKDPMMAALLDVPEMITPTTLSTGVRGNRGATLSPSAVMSYRHSLAQSTPETDEEKDLLKKRQDAADAIIDEALGVQKETPKLDLTIPPPPTGPLGTTGEMPPPGQTFNLMPGASPVPPPAAVPKRVKVKGPGGKTGTVPEGTALPDGWTLVE